VIFFLFHHQDNSISVEPTQRIFLSFSSQYMNPIVELFRHNRNHETMKTDKPGTCIIYPATQHNRKKYQQFTEIFFAQKTFVDFFLTFELFFLTCECFILTFKYFFSTFANSSFCNMKIVNQGFEEVFQGQEEITKGRKEVKKGSKEVKKGQKIGTSKKHCSLCSN